MTEPTTMEPEDILLSVITCPHCDHQRAETMPECSCVIFYQCQECATMLRPADGDCCVYCTYGSAPCPPIQRLRRSAQAAGG